MFGNERASSGKSYVGLNGLLWTQTSGEHVGVCMQAFTAARINLVKAIGDRSWTAALEQESGYESLPPAVIMDIDETVVDNSPYFASKMVDATVGGRKLWDAWSDSASAQPLPGAREFIAFAREKGVEVLFVTNRHHRNEANTRRNLNSVGIAVPKSPKRDPKAPDCAVLGTDRVLTRLECDTWTADKTTRRATIAEHFRIVMIIGDDFNDFVTGTKVSPDKQRQLATKYGDYWGSRWIVLPNTLYGSWERAQYGFDRSMSDDKKLHRKLDNLRPFTPNWSPEGTK